VARIRTLASTLEIEGRMTFAGLVGPARVSALLRDADVLVMPTTETRWARYTSPLKLFEYMAAGKPIVASDLPAIREILTDGENACLVAPGDAHALAAGIRRVLDDPALAARIARRAFEDAAAYSWDRRAERLEALLSDVVKRP
jgi:glycosyltransferase involved in cell wall biosynthesis